MRERSVSAAVVLLGLLAMVLLATRVVNPAFAVTAGIGLLVVPGYAVTCWTRVRDPLRRACLAVGLSALIEVLASLAMVWLHLWHPSVLAYAVLAAGTAAVLVSLRTRSRERVPAAETVEPARGRRADRHLAASRFASVPFWGALAVAVVLWLVSMATTTVDNLGQWGLIPRLGPAWYLAVALCLALVIATLCSRRVSFARMAGSTAALLVMIYGSAAVVEPVPRLAYVYKHVAVTSYIGVHGSVNTAIDIYNRWPGFFAFTAFIGRATGYDNPVSYVAWAEPLFALIDAVLVLAIARTISRDPRWCWTATLVFSLCNWIGQNYFSPQALAFSLYLVVCLLCFSVLRAVPRRLGTGIERLLQRLLRAGRAPVEATATWWTPCRGRATPAIVVLVLFAAAISATHQLTPYLAVAGLLPLFVVGYLRPTWVGIVLAAVPVLYLVPNYSYIQAHFGLFSSFDPVANATYTPVSATVLGASLLQSRLTLVLSALSVLFAVIGWVRRSRRGDVRSALVLAWLSFAPSLSLASQTYGGEGRLRVYLFALPWLAMGAAWMLWPGSRAAALDSAEIGHSTATDDSAEADDGAEIGHSTATDNGAVTVAAARPSLRVRVVTATALTVLAAIFVTTAFQPEADEQVWHGDVAAAEWLDARVTQGDVVLSTGPTFPFLIGPHYDRIVSSNGTLADFIQYYPTGITQGDLRTILASLGPKAAHHYVVFSVLEARNAAVHELFRHGELEQVRADVTADPTSRKVYDRLGTQIYEVG